ncbi:MAG: IS4 family transposase [Deltaproteobacteria bacterium]|nr:IS4 family transposase [Deltaproteobacteria bacterium]
MEAEDVRRVFETILPDAVLLEVIEAAKLQERERKLDALRFLRAMVIAASTVYGGRQADVARLYFESGAPDIVRGGFYRWFGPPLETAMVDVSNRALAYARSQPVDLPGWLGFYVRDWHIVDSTTISLHGRLKEEYPGTGDYAALKVHKRFSVGIGTTIEYHLSPAREHDAPHLKVDASWAGLGLLVDLGYASIQLLRDCEEHGVKYVIRLKENWKPKVDRIMRGTLKGAFEPGSDLRELLERKVLKLDGKVLSAAVCIGTGRNAVNSRLVAVPTDKGYCFYLTNLPGEVGPRQVADLYRVRWEIESNNKLDKSCCSLDKIGARTGPAARALVHASMVSSTIVCLLAHHHQRSEAPPPEPNTERTEPPIHPQTLARVVGSAATSIAAAMSMRGAAAKKEWARLAALFTYHGKDPNWRRRPSILDQLRGWRVTPGQPRHFRAASVSGRSGLK